MKRILVYFTKPVSKKITKDRWNKETKKWDYDVECEEISDSFEFYSLSNAKKFIKENIEFYKGSSITKIFSNGDFENLGEIKINGCNKHFIANTKQKKAGY